MAHSSITLRDGMIIGIPILTFTYINSFKIPHRFNIKIQNSLVCNEQNIPINLFMNY